MNYRHAFHAGNFADVMKHAVLTHLLESLTATPRPLTVIDTHAGAGLYDLDGPMARRTGESRAAIVELMATADAPSVFDALKAAVRRTNRRGRKSPAPDGFGGCRFYPGSPLLIAEALRPRDHYIACELRPDDHAALKTALPRQLGAEVLKADGWRIAAERTPAAPADVLLFIDPPFERGDDYHQAVSLSGRTLAKNAGAVVAIWLPIKDLARFDGFLGDVEDATAGRAALIAEVRLRPLADPMALNGCALVVINPPHDLEAHAKLIVDYVARTMGSTGGAGRTSLIPAAR